MSYLNDPRVFFAAERTLLAWQRTAIALIGLGFVVERFGLFMRLATAGLTADGARLPPLQGHLSLAFGVAFLLLGAVVAAVAAWQFGRFLHDLSGPEIPRGHATWLGPAINYALALTALAMVVWLVATAPSS